MEEDFKKCLSDISSALSNSLLQEEDMENKNLISDDFIKKLKDKGFNKPEDFNYLFVYKLQSLLNYISRRLHDPSINNEGNEKISFIYINYRYLEENITELCRQKDGSSCCADKGRTIVEIYFNYCLTGKKIKLNPTKESFGVPRFGTFEQWMAYCDGLYNLYYGRPTDYIKSYTELIKSERKLFKYIYNNWYIKFKDGVSVMIDITYDDDKENPLNNDFYDKGDYYKIPRRCFSKTDKIFEIYDSSILGRNYYKVLKSEIENIYMESQEVYS